MNISKSLDLLKRATWYEILYVSVIIIPLPLFAWTQILDWIELSNKQKQIWLVALITVQLVGIFSYVFGASRYRKKLSTLSMVMGYLEDKNFKMVSFERIQEKYGSTYSDDYLRSLITTFPEHVRFAKLQGGKPGIARLGGRDATKSEVATDVVSKSNASNVS